MNWVKENKFLTGYIVGMVVGVGFLGFKVFSASGALDEANTRYTSKASRYNTLRHLAPYPDRENLAVFEQQKNEAAEVITAFQSELAKREFPIEPLSPERFQDKLKTAVTEIRAKAATANVTLPKDKFYLGFDRYETAPPDKDAAALLGRDLKAIHWVIEQLINAPIAELRELKRPELPEEKGGKVAGGGGNRPPGQGGGPNRPGGNRSARQDLVSSHSFDVVVICKQRQLANVLNSIISAKAPQFYIPRAVRVTNQNPKGPPREVADPNVAAAAAAADAKVVPKGAGDIHYIVGEEMVEASLRLEIVDFAEPSASKTK
jgi:hypothetical protein